MQVVLSGGQISGSVVPLAMFFINFPVHIHLIDDLISYLHIISPAPAAQIPLLLLQNLLRPLFPQLYFNLSEKLLVFVKTKNVEKFLKYEIISSPGLAAQIPLLLLQDHLRPPLQFSPNSPPVTI